MVATARLAAEPQFVLFFGSQNIVAIGKSMIRYFTFHANQNRASVRTRPLQGRNAMLKQRREATFIDCCHTKTAIYAVANDVGPLK